MKKINGVESKDLSLFDSFQANVLFSHPLKTSEYHRFYDIFRGYGNGTLGRNRLIWNNNNFKV